jgi:hypothetical protein
MVGRLSEIRKSLGDSNVAQSWTELDRGDVIERRDKKTGQVLETIKKGAAPRDTGAGIEQRAALQFQRDFQRTNQLADDYRNESQEVAKAANGFRSVSSVAPAAREGAPAAQIALVFGYMKTLDPSSVVRESEYATAENARGVPESVRNQYNKVLSGSRLTPSQVDGMLSAARSSAKGWKRQQDNFTKVYGQRATRAKVDVDGVVLDYFDGLDMSDPPPLSQILGGKK